MTFVSTTTILNMVGLRILLSYVHIFFLFIVLQLTLPVRNCVLLCTIMSESIHALLLSEGFFLCIVKKFFFMQPLHLQCVLISSRYSASQEVVSELFYSTSTERRCREVQGQVTRTPATELLRGRATVHYTTVCFFEGGTY